MTAIAASTSAAPSTPAPAAGFDKDAAQGFGALLAQAGSATAANDKAATRDARDMKAATAKAADRAANAKAADRASDAKADKAADARASDKADNTRTASAKDADGAVQDSKDPAETTVDAVVAQDAPAAAATAGQADAAALAAAALIAAMQAPQVEAPQPVTEAAEAAPAAPTTDAVAFVPVAPDAEPAVPAAAVATDAADAAPVLDLPDAPVLSAADLAAAALKAAATPTAKAEAAATPAAAPVAPPTPAVVDAALAAAAAAPTTDTAKAPAATDTDTAAAQVVAPEVTSVTGKIVQPAEQKTVAAAVAANADAAAEPVPADAVQSAHAATTGDGGAEGQGDNGGSQGAQTAQAAPVAAEASSTAPTFIAPGTTAAPAPIAAAHHPVKAAPETVAHLTTEITSKAQVGKTSRFDVVLQPEGLGRVDVRIEIAKDGKLTAALNFDNPQAAADLRGKSAELRQALADAGFNVADNALSFDSSRQQGGGQNQNPFLNFQGGEHGRQAFHGRAFQSALAQDAAPLSPSALLPGLRVAERSGVDLKI